MSQHRVLISGTGYCVPDRVVGNRTIEGLINTTSEFVATRTGVKERRHATQGTALSDLIEPAARDAIKDAGLAMQDIDMLIVNTLSPDYHDPSVACLVQHRLGMAPIPSFDIRAQCSGLLYGMDIASQYISTGKARHVLVVCGEVLSKRLDTSDEGRNVSIMLGDGAGAAVMSAARLNGSTTEAGLVDLIIRADGEHYFLMYTEAPGTVHSNYITAEALDAGRHHFRMKGRALTEHCMKVMPSVAREILEKHKLTMEDIDIVVPHQVNLRFLELLADELKIPMERIAVTIDHLGNMASGSMAVTLAIARKQGGFRPGGRVLFLGYGSGATWGAALYQN